MRKRIKVVRRAGRGEIDFNTADFDYQLSSAEVDDLNKFCINEIQLIKEPNKELEDSIQDELELAIEYDVSSLEGFKDWLALAAVFGWFFIKQKPFEELEKYLKEPNSTDNDRNISQFISQLTEDL
jgi:hypothetical protein